MSFIRHSLKDEILYSQKLLSEINLDKEQIINEVKQLLELFKDNENQHPLSLSGGEKRKLIFNLLKLSDPEIYILDEPTVGLDYYAIQELKKEIISLKLRNKKVIIITHDLKFLLSITDEVLILQKDEHTGMSSICYQGSLSRYLIHNEEVAKLILTIPIEFTIYKNKLLSNEIPSQTMYFDFLQSQVT
jgi:energy-coupling factor transporter ATP-binding protein EcfA2